MTSSTGVAGRKLDGQWPTDATPTLGEKANGVCGAPKLVAAAEGGRNRGRIPGKFISAVPASFGRAIDLPDNAESPGTILTGTDRTGGLIDLTATCADQNPAPGVEHPPVILG